MKHLLHVQKENIDVFTNKTVRIATSRSSRQRGFTLIEMLVAVGLFSVVMLVAVSVILSIIGNNRKAQGINNVVNNLNFAIESMVRDMKTGYLYKCDPNTFPISQDTSSLCPDATVSRNSIEFFSTLSGTPTPVQYRFIPPTTASDGVYTPGHIVKRTGTGLGNGDVDLTSKTDVDIQNVEMYIHSPTPGNSLNPSQPSIFLIIRGKANILENEVTEFGLQTFISQRVLNL
jgi:prepilin-type N-terminal cleavage/methylation domain-containing protein